MASATTALQLSYKLLVNIYRHLSPSRNTSRLIYLFIFLEHELTVKRPCSSLGRLWRYNFVKLHCMWAFIMLTLLSDCKQGNPMLKMLIYSQIICWLTNYCTWKINSHSRTLCGCQLAPYTYYAAENFAGREFFWQKLCIFLHRLQCTNSFCSIIFSTSVEGYSSIAL